MIDTSFFKKKESLPTKNNDFKVYYIPVVELVGDMQHLCSWRYARNPLVSRMFYTSTEDLFTQEGLEAGRTAVSCYKVMLDATQIAALNQNKNIGRAQLMALNFMPHEILSCIHLSEHEHAEVMNPYYQARETAAMDQLMTPCA